ncbi:Hypothetical predicted protein [Octopus vulgaris]|uniref:Uncharacterized protein n=1 Tax=Octopus vulgaris TaxID=6645 RepID=A0AA36B5X7_OCTVU|nr:Hypothetical predicted protein [Octopus vulgaris]
MLPKFMKLASSTVWCQSLVGILIAGTKSLSRKLYKSHWQINRVKQKDFNFVELLTCRIGKSTLCYGGKLTD